MITVRIARRPYLRQDMHERVELVGCGGVSSTPLHAAIMASSHGSWSNSSIVTLGAGFGAASAALAYFLHGCGGDRHSGYGSETPEERMKAIKKLNDSKPQLLPLTLLAQKQPVPPQAKPKEEEPAVQTTQETGKKFTLLVKVQAEGTKESKATCFLVLLPSQNYTNRIF